MFHTWILLRMRLTELFADTRIIVATQRFFREYPKFAKKYTNFRNNLRDFLLFRQSAGPTQQFNSKDTMLTGPSWKGLHVRHCHLVHGKAMVLYQLGRIEAGDTLNMLTIEEHDGVEGRNVARLIHYVQSLSPEDFMKFDVPADTQPTEPEPEHALDKAQIKDLMSLFLLLVHNPDDREVLVDAAKGRFDDFLEWARMTLGFDDTSQDKAIINALGGNAMLAKRAGLWIEKVSV